MAERLRGGVAAEGEEEEKCLQGERLQQGGSSDAHLCCERSENQYLLPQRQLAGAAAAGIFFFSIFFFFCPFFSRGLEGERKKGAEKNDRSQHR
ncbi:MAG: hypothetical protein WC565_08605 [Parcubacteria group bacterium]